MLLLAAYGMLLMAVGLMRSASFHRVMRKYGFWADDEDTWRWMKTTPSLWNVALIAVELHFRRNSK